MERLFDIAGKTVVITGASSGIGRGVAEFLARNGARVCMLARRERRLEEIAEKICLEGHECLPLKCDVCNEGEVMSSVEKIIGRWGKVDVLINNAGTTEKSEDITAHTAIQWDRTMDTNLKAAYLVSREIVPHMKKAKYGKIINIASIAGLMGLANQASYCASKAGLIGLTKSMAVELGKYNITVNAVAPGYIITELTNISGGGYGYFRERTVFGEVGKVEDLYGAVMLLATDASRYMTGDVLAVDGGIMANL